MINYGNIIYNYNNYNGMLKKYLILKKILMIIQLN